MTAQLQHGIERFRRRGVREAGWQFVAPRLKLVQQAGRGLHRVSPLLWSTADRPASGIGIITDGFAGTVALRRAL
jgi:hypothetical protein